MQAIKTQANTLTIADAPFDDKEIIFHVLNDLGSNYREILIVIYAHDSPISFKKLYNKFFLL